MNKSLASLLAEGGFFQGYAYAYPHKTAYRPLSPPRQLQQVWAREAKDSLFLYLHVPFCEMRCGFCNLFTTTHPDSGLVAAYLKSIRRQAEVVSQVLGHNFNFNRLAIGGGTPTFLTTTEMQLLFDILNKVLLFKNQKIPKAIEVSPSTVDDDKLALFKSEGITRLSMGGSKFRRIGG